VNRPKLTRYCRICRRRFENDYALARTAKERERVLRQMTFGMCTACQRRRQSAGDDAMDHDPTMTGEPGPARAQVSRNRALMRVSDAAERCRLLGM
jgi:hypothetical protein